MRFALLFSGQGGQTKEHLRQVLHETPASFRPSLEEALPFLEDTGERIQENQFAQPLIFALQMHYWTKLQPQLPRPVCAAGYSLGEMAAACAAGLFTPEIGIKLCAERAKLMDGATRAPSGMFAVLGLSDETLATIAKQFNFDIAIRNGPAHRVLAGPRERLDAAEQACLAAGASRTVRLAVFTPSHTTQLRPASSAFAERLADFEDGKLAFPVVSAIDGRPAYTRAQASANLASQLSTPMDWESCMQTLVEFQPDVVLEIGPGNALARLWNEIAPNIPVRSCEDFRNMEGIVRWVSQYRSV